MGGSFMPLFNAGCIDDPQPIFYLFAEPVRVRELQAATVAKL